MSNSNMQEVVDELRHENSWLTNKVRVFEEQVQEGEDINRGLLKDNEFLKASQKQMESKNHCLEIEIEDIKSTLAKITNEKKDLLVDVSLLTDRLETSKSEVSNIALDSNFYKVEWEKLSEKVVEQEELITRMSESLSKFQSESTLHKKALRESEHSRKEMLKNKQFEIDTLKEHLAIAQTNIQTAEDNLLSLQQNNGLQLCSQCDENEILLEKKEATIEELESRLETTLLERRITDGQHASKEDDLLQTINELQLQARTLTAHTIAITVLMEIVNSVEMKGKGCVLPKPLEVCDANTQCCMDEPTVPPKPLEVCDANTQCCMDEPRDLPEPLELIDADAQCCLDKATTAAAIQTDHVCQDTESQTSLAGIWHLLYTSACKTKEVSCQIGNLPIKPEVEDQGISATVTVCNKLVNTDQDDTTIPCKVCESSVKPNIISRDMTTQTNQVESEMIQYQHGDGLDVNQACCQCSVSMAIHGSNPNAEHLRTESGIASSTSHLKNYLDSSDIAADTCISALEEGLHRHDQDSSYLNSGFHSSHTGSYSTPSNSYNRFNRQPEEQWLSQRNLYNARESNYFDSRLSDQFSTNNNACLDTSNSFASAPSVDSEYYTYQCSEHSTMNSSMEHSLSAEQSTVQHRSISVDNSLMVGAVIVLLIGCWLWFLHDIGQDPHECTNAVCVLHRNHSEFNPF